MTDKQKVADKSSTSVSTAKADEASVAELSVKEVEDRLAFANAARCDIGSSKAEE